MELNNSQGRASPMQMSNTFEPMEEDTALSPKPVGGGGRGGVGVGREGKEGVEIEVRDWREWRERGWGEGEVGEPGVGRGRLV
jgi:hypothetical protein